MTTATVSTLEFPSVRITEPERCAVCDTYMPAGWYAIVADDGDRLCTASCLAKVAPLYVEVAGSVKIAEEWEMEASRLRERARGLRDDAYELERDAYELEREAERIEHAINNAQRIAA